VISLPPKTLGSHNSLLIAMLAPGKVKLKEPDRAKLAAELSKKHEKVIKGMSQADLVRIITWVDSNAQFYGSYWGRKNVSHKGHKNYRPVVSFEHAINTVSPLPEDQR